MTLVKLHNSSASHFRATSVCILALTATLATNADAREQKNFLSPVVTDRDAPMDDRPSHFSPSQSAFGGDTLSFGYVDSDGFAVAGEAWTFDHGGADPLEGWEETDVTQNDAAYFCHISAAAWPPENNVAAPVLSGAGSAWCGAFELEANQKCWESGLGYGNSWTQDLASPVFTRAALSDVELDFAYFCDVELDYDFVTAYVRTLPSGQEVELFQFTDQVGLSPSHPASPPVGAPYSADLPDAIFSGETDFQVIFRMTSDGGWSDEDAQYATEFGPFALDDVAVNDGAALHESFGFETDLEGWMPTAFPGTGGLMGVADRSSYVFEDGCGAPGLVGNVLEFHDDNQEHPYGQRVLGATPPVNVLRDVPPLPSAQLEIFADWEQYSYQPRANGVFYRPGWSYYPYICPVNEVVMWSSRRGQASFYSTGDDPVAFSARNVATNNGIPSEVEQIRFLYEVYASCDGFSIGPEECTGETNFTPIIDNVQIRFTYKPNAPSIAYEPGTQFQDGYGQSLLMDRNQPGNADVTLDVRSGENRPWLGDSLMVRGPVSESGTEWDARLWFRVARKGPGSNTSGYDGWRNRVEQSGGIDLVDGITNIEAGDFATAKMDSFQIGQNPQTSGFHSYYIEEDARFDVGAGENTDGNEIIADGVLLPGTQVEYFVTSNYVTSPESMFLLPDTSGGFFSEFEILPGWVQDGPIHKFPALLYVDAHNRGAQNFIEPAFEKLNLVYDRYDYLDASSNWKAPMARGLGSSNNGLTIFQLLGYRGVLVNTGDLSGSVMEPEDFSMYSDWLTAISCDGNSSSQSLVLNGDNVALIVQQRYPDLLFGPLGTFVAESSYRLSNPSDENFCVRMESLGAAGEFGTRNSFDLYEYDAWGNGCQDEHDFDVLQPTGSGVGNRAYVNATSGEVVEFAQVVNVSPANQDNFRTVVDGVSWHHLSKRDDVEECVADSAHIVTAAFSEIAASLEWAFDTAAQHIPIPEWRDEPCNGGTSDVDEPPLGSFFATRLLQNQPNPFNPRTRLRFSLAASGPLELSIFDVNGRKIRTLESGVKNAGSYEASWDGTDDQGLSVAAGVYWSQLEASGNSTNKKMILVR